MAKIKEPKIIKKKDSRVSRFDTFGLGEEKEYLVENLGVLLASGMDIIDALESIKIEIRSKILKKIITNIQDDINGGSSLWEALEKSYLLPKHIISLIKIGESSGQLQESLAVIVVQQQKNRSFRSKIRSAMMYPVFVMALALIVGIGISWFILPRLATVFSQLNLELPLVTRILIGFGSFLSAEGVWAVPSSIATLLVIIYFIFIFKPTKFLGQKILFHLPGIKKLILEIELSRMGYIVGTLLQAGLPIVDTIESLSDASPLHNYKKLYSQLALFLKDGKSFQEFFAANKKIKKMIPIPVQGLIVVGERSGRLSEIFLNVGKTYEERTDLTTKNLSVILEPILLIVVWLGVVAVALAVILPIYSLVGGLNKKPAARPPRPVSTIITETNTSTIAVVDFSTSTTSTIKLPTTPPEIMAVPGTQMVTILDTGIGYLNVRSEPSTQAKILQKVNVGTSYPYLDKQNGWYNIILPDGQIGWVSERYTKLVP
ncbi:MAG: type II secretion system F family protein [Candidatus Magasanikbacteria bacterium]